MIDGRHRLESGALHASLGDLGQRSAGSQVLGIRAQISGQCFFFGI